MSEPMTTPEALQAMRDRRSTTSEQYTAVEFMIAHAERTLAARKGEPYVLRELRDDMRLDQERLWASSHLDTLVAHIDALTAQLAEARRERDAEIARTLRLTERLGNTMAERAALTSPAGMHSAPAQPATEADRP